MQAATLTGGFARPQVEAALAFRAIMEAMARPGLIVEVSGAAPPAPVSAAAGAAALVLLDPGTPLFLAPSHDRLEIRDWLAFHTGAPPAPPSGCAFALGTWPALAPIERFPVGTAEYPDRSATLIVEMPELLPEGAVLTGPGIAGETRLNLPDIAALRRNAARFPLGVDLILTCGSRLAALPRSTRLEAR